MPIKRPHYFDHQFLVEADFTAEQQYHLDMRRRLNRLLHTFGIADGLEVVKSANKTVTVRPGVALDRDGQEMIIEANQAVNLNDAARFSAGATVFITIAYQEQESDPTTAADVSGNTRVTEQPVIQAVTTAPPNDGTVIPLARFTLDGNANVPRNINDLFDGGVRQMVGPRGERGLASLNGVSNPGSNIDLVAPAGQAITIAPNNANNRIVISENHSTQTGNVHGLTAANLQQIGALLASDYALQQHAVANMIFSQQDTSGATRTINVGFQPKIVLVHGACNAVMSGRGYGAGVSAVAALEGKLQQICFGYFITRFSNTDWSSQATILDTICLGSFSNQGVTPIQAENLFVTISSVSATGLTAVLTRDVIATGNAPLPNFDIFLLLLCMG